MKYSSPLFTITSLLLSSNIVSAEGPAGNERYTHNKRATSLEPRSGSQGASHSSITFSANGGQGNKEYISPIGPLFKSHVLTNDWGVEKIAQDVLRITVFDVEGEVNCASLSRQVDAFEASDDVWDKVSLAAIHRSLLSRIMNVVFGSPLVILASRRLAVHKEFSRRIRSARMSRGMGRKVDRQERQRDFRRRSIRPRSRQGRPGTYCMGDTLALSVR
jgi:hypothetical protein